MKRFLQKENWYVAYTYPRSERKAQKRLEDIGVKSFLPMHRVIRQWSDRKKKLEVPLFPNYIFIRTNFLQRYSVIKIPELLYYVSFGGEPVIVPEDLIFSLRKVMDENIEIVNENFGKVGERIRISEGKFMGVEGVVLRQNGRTRLVIGIDALQQSVLIDIPAACVEAVA